MAIVVNTNLQALEIQTNLNKATTAMNQAMKRMSTGYKINSSSDDAAGAAISTKLETTLSSSKVAYQNAQIGSNLLTTTESTLDTIKANVQRIRDLAEQSANGTYNDRSAMLAEVNQRVAEIDRLANVSDFNGIKLLDGSQTAGIALQVGTGATANDSITLSSSIFAKATASAIGLGTSAQITAAFATAAASKTFLTNADNALTNITGRQTSIGAFQNRLSSAQDALVTQQTNLSATNSTIKDADVATESAAYVKAQILQSASASLLAQANAAPQLALKLIGG